MTLDPFNFFSSSNSAMYFFLFTDIPGPAF